jgi:hypothetical protein
VEEKVKEKLIVGRYVKFQDPKPKITYTDGSFLTQPKLAMTLEQSVKEKQLVPKWDAKGQDFVRDDSHQTVQVSQKQRISQMSAGEHQSKEHRNFQWLGYYGGAVSQVALDDLDVLSGNFSGCWMTVYRNAGITYVCHVGSVDDATHAKTIAAKKAWNDFAQANPQAILRGFNPARSWTHPDSRPPKIDGDGLARIWGLVTRDEMISIYVYRGEKDWDRYRIAGLQVVQPPSQMPELGNI